MYIHLHLVANTILRVCFVFIRRVCTLVEGISVSPQSSTSFISLRRHCCVKAYTPFPKQVPELAISCEICTDSPLDRRLGGGSGTRTLLYLGRETASELRQVNQLHSFQSFGACSAPESKSIYCVAVSKYSARMFPRAVF
jgi:hypothetical protein